MLQPKFEIGQPVAILLDEYESWYPRFYVAGFATLFIEEIRITSTGVEYVLTTKHGTTFKNGSAVKEENVFASYDDVQKEAQKRNLSVYQNYARDHLQSMDYLPFSLENSGGEKHE